MTAGRGASGLPNFSPFPLGATASNTGNLVCANANIFPILPGILVALEIIPNGEFTGSDTQFS